MRVLRGLILVFEFGNFIFVFFSKKIKINLNQPIRSVEQKDTETVNQSIEEDRKILIQVNRINDYFIIVFGPFCLGSYCSNNESSTNTTTCFIDTRSYSTINSKI
jgi:hypothetical protein